MNKSNFSSVLLLCLIKFRIFILKFVQLLLKMLIYEKNVVVTQISTILYFYLKHIINITINGLSWNKLSLLLSINTDLIRKKYIK